MKKDVLIIIVVAVLIILIVIAITKRERPALPVSIVEKVVEQMSAI